MASPYTKEQIIEALRANKGMVTLAADSLKCNSQTIYNWIKRSPDVAAVVNAERERVIDVAEIALMGAIQRKEGWAIAFALKTIGKKRGYVERTEQVNFNVDTDLLKRTLDAIEKQGLSASDIFNNILAELDSQSVGADGGREGESG